MSEPPASSGNGLEVNAGKYGLKITGKDVIIAVLLVASIGLMWWSQQQGTIEHGNIAREIRLQTCVLSLSVDDKMHLRKNLAPTRDASTIHAAMAMVCPWLTSGLSSER